MLGIVSWITYFLLIISRLAKNIAAITNGHESIVKFTVFGVIVIKIPIIPTNVTIHNFNEILSFRIIGARISINIRVVKLIIVAIITCDDFNPLIHKNIANARNKPLIKW